VSVFLCEKKVKQGVSEETRRSQEGQGYSDSKGENTSVELRDQTSCVASMLTLI